VKIAVVDGFEVVRTEGELDEPFQAGSVSKPVAAFTALRLVDSGALELDKDVNDRLVSWQVPDGDGVTLRRLLTHTAGVGVPFYPGYEPDATLPSLLQVLEAVRVEAPLGEFRYSGGGYMIVQLLLEDVTGEPFAELARELVFEPLGMSRSTFEQRVGSARRYAEQAAAGLWTTAADLGRFVGALQRDAQPMWTPQVELPLEGEWREVAQLGLRPPERFGLGLFLQDGWFGHFGSAFDSVSAIYGSTEGGSGVVVAASDAVPVIEAVLAAAAERGWEGLRV
jgi:CubicO group peptidase (beta-lactamase class C family)